MRGVVGWGGVALVVLVLAAPAAGAGAGAAAVERVPGQPYERHSTTDGLGREITYYLSEAPRGTAPLPLVVYIQGSGGQSNFVEQEGRIVPQNGHSTVEEVCRSRARILIVEKPGVKYLDPRAKPGDPPGSPEFCREHTLERWSEVVIAAIRSARALPEIRKDRMLVIGHSEGGIVACRVAREVGDSVTHVATLAGGGPTQLYDLISLARRGKFKAMASDDPETRVKLLLDEWSQVLADSTSAEKLFLGHPYRRWVSFLRSSPMQELAPVRARIYIAQGRDDRAGDPESADMLYAQLRAAGKDVTYDRLDGADHSFRQAAKSSVDGWKEEVARVVGWFLGG